MSREEMIQRMSVAYLALLGLPHASTSRTRLQGALATLRDEISVLSGRGPQEVQDNFEETAERLRIIAGQPLQ